VEAQREFEIDVTTSADGMCATVTLAGEVDMASAHEIDAVVAVVAGWSETAEVIVDLSRVTFIDSTGIAALLRCRQELDDARIGFGLVGARGMPLTVLEITGVLPFLSVGAGAVNVETI